MTQDLDTIYKKLTTYLENIPVKKKANFKIESVNNGEMSIHGWKNTNLLIMDQVNIGNNVETRWVIQDRSIQFVIYSGNIDLHFRLNDNIHIKHLSVTQSLRIPSGIPFMLKTFEKDCSVLLIASKEEKGVTNG